MISNQLFQLKEKRAVVDSLYCEHGTTAPLVNGSYCNITITHCTRNVKYCFYKLFFMNIFLTHSRSSLFVSAPVIPRNSFNISVRVSACFFLSSAYDKQKFMDLRHFFTTSRPVTCNTAALSTRVCFSRTNMVSIAPCMKKSLA